VISSCLIYRQGSSFAALALLPHRNGNHQQPGFDTHGESLRSSSRFISRGALDLAGAALSPQLARRTVFFV
jgi:hypothetical protein